MPNSAQPPQAPPRLLPSSPAPAPAPAPVSAPPAPAANHTFLSWSDNKLVFHSASLGGGGDVLVFAKGSRQGINMSPGDVQCLYSGATMVDASFPAITSTQQVTRCPSPPPSLNYCRVTLVLRGQETLPSIATYTPNRSGLSVTHDKKLICACTMVRNVAKFLSEWVRHHAGIGVDHFYLYDNGSEDNLADQVAQLNAAGFKVLTVAWPWTKTQEAGFSHCAAVYRSSCEWMAFIDVDEFVFSPKWHSFDNPSKSMLQEVVSVDPQVGQIYLPCYDFGPSGQTAHPTDGVCQGYTCRIEKAERHKSLVRLDAVDDSLKNSIHHFQIKSGFDSEWRWLTRVNHYKFQAWPEFKQKFDRRVSAYVTDWKDRANLQSGDRAPGLGVEAIEPDDWPRRYCDRNDSVMKDTSIKWFGVGLRGRGADMVPAVGISAEIVLAAGTGHEARDLGQTCLCPPLHEKVGDGSHQRIGLVGLAVAVMGHSVALNIVEKGLAGAPVDQTIATLAARLEQGDYILNGGNEWYEKTERREKAVEERGLLYLGVGVS